MEKMEMTMAGMMNMIQHGRPARTSHNAGRPINGVFELSAGLFSRGIGHGIRITHNRNPAHGPMEIWSDPFIQQDKGRQENAQVFGKICEFSVEQRDAHLGKE